LDNTFEIYGFDFLVDDLKNVYLLEANAFPDFQQTGNKLSYVISQMFDQIVNIAILPFFDQKNKEDNDYDISIDNDDDKNFCLIYKK